MSEIDKSRDLITPYFSGNVLDLGSSGWPCVEHAIQLDLERYHRPPNPPVQFVGDAFGPLPFRDGVFDTVLASHILEDTLDWEPVVREWCRVIKPTGELIIQVPDRTKFRAAVAAGQPDNPNHKHESYVGELTELVNKIGGFRVIMERCVPDGDYNILGIFSRKP